MGSQLKFKENKVRNNLKHIGGFENPKVLPTLGMQEPLPLPEQSTVSGGL